MENVELRNTKRAARPEVEASPVRAAGEPEYVGGFDAGRDALPVEGDCSRSTSYPGGGLFSVSLSVNGQPHSVDVEPRVVLLDLLRDQLRLTGSKKGCDHGQCGACTVLVNGQRMNCCLSLAVMHEGDEITTIEGLERNGALHPMQQAFLDCDGFQCGGCTSGQIMSAVGLLREPVGSDDAAVRDSLSGNLCRCGAYPGILAAVQSVRRAAETR